MSRTIVLVTRDEVTQELFEQACAASTLLRTHVVEGSLAEGENAIEAIDTNTREVLLAMFAPRSATATGAADFTTRLGYAPPLGEDGRCWITQFAMPSTEVEQEILAVLDVIRTLAANQHGYLIVDGERVPLDGVPDPSPATAPEPSVRPMPTLFAAAMFARATPPGDGGWAWLRERMLIIAGPHLAPERVSVNGGLEAYKPGYPETDEATEFERSDPWAEMSFYDACYPHQWYSGVDLDAEASAAEGEAMLGRLLPLAPDGVEYAAIAWWHDDDAMSPDGLREWTHGIPADSPSRDLFLGARGLAKYLPDLYWAQIVGPPWVELWGADRIASTPAYRVEEVAPATWLIQLTPHLADVTDDRDTYVAVRAKAKRHLGADCFFDRERGNYAEYRAARIPTLGERGLA